MPLQRSSLERILNSMGISSWTRVCEGHSVEPCASSVTSAIPSTPSCFELTGPQPLPLGGTIEFAYELRGFVELDTFTLTDGAGNVPSAPDGGPSLEPNRRRSPVDEEEYAVRGRPRRR